MTGSSAVPVGVAPLEIECIQSAAGLEALRTVWSALADRAEGGAIYGGPAWLLPWARHHPWAHPYVLAARRGDRLTALLPLCVCEQGRGPVRWRALRFAADELADSCDAVWDPEWPGDLEALWEALLARKDWHLLDLRYVPSDSPLAGLARAASPRMRVLCEQTDAFLYLDLGPEWLQSLPKSQRSKLLRRRRQIGEEGDVSFTVAQTPGDVESKPASSALLTFGRGCRRPAASFLLGASSTCAGSLSTAIRSALECTSGRGARS